MVSRLGINIQDALIRIKAELKDDHNSIEVTNDKKHQDTNQQLVNFTSHWNSQIANFQRDIRSLVDEGQKRIN